MTEEDKLGANRWFGWAIVSVLFFLLVTISGFFVSQIYSSVSELGRFDMRSEQRTSVLEVQVAVIKSEQQNIAAKIDSLRDAIMNQRNRP